MESYGLQNDLAFGSLSETEIIKKEKDSIIKKKPKITYKLF